MVKRTLLLLCLLSTGIAGWSGDVAQFVNLGFSPDGAYYMFGVYGILEKTAAPYAELYVVDVRANVFAPRGVKKVTYTQPAEPAASGLGALLTALEDASVAKRQYRIDHLVTGRLLYVLVDGAPDPQPLEFRDFVTARKYAVSLVQSSGTKDGQPAASFHVKVTITDKDGTTTEKDIGNPAYQRPGVRSYRVKQIMLGPDGSSLVFVIQKEEVEGAGVNVRYMVETTRL